MFARAVSGFSRNSQKHSSSTTKIPSFSHLLKICSSNSAEIVRPVGFIGEQRNSMSIFSVRDSSTSSPGSNCRSRFSGIFSTIQPTAKSARSYSEKAGAVTSALPGLLANASRKSNSAAPFPNTMFSSPTPYAFAVAARSFRQRLSG